MKEKPLKITNMGYMGFGMQRWIYTRSIRKPFEKPHLKGSDNDFRHRNDINLVANSLPASSKKRKLRKYVERMDPFPASYVIKKLVTIFVITLILVGFFFILYYKGIISL